ncbi:MAG: hypothetical protein HGB10_01995 [Coriobacteriia bacterium]|nr:hypothetical protein [Coriobacteriia bacterium]
MAIVAIFALVLPLQASGFISTGPTGDRAWFWHNPQPQGNDLRASAWLDASTGWAVGVVGTALKTTDGGATWVAQDPGTVRDLTGVSFVDANNGWACGVSATVVRTTNGGTTWTPQTAPTTPAARNLRAISFFNSSVGVAVGDLGTTTSTIVYTGDGGTTWRTATTTATVGLTGVQMVSATTGWAVGGAGAILKTTDGGATWTPVSSPTVAGLSAVSFEPSGQVGYVVGNAALPSWTIYKTTDAGVTWTAVDGLGATGAINLTAVDCLDANNAITVGTNGQVRHTTDGGATWLNQSLNNLGGQALRDVELVDADVIKATGDFGQLFFTRNGGDSWFTPAIGAGATYLAGHFADVNNGWIVGASGTIMRTADAGQTWEIQSSGITNWRAIHARSATAAWVVGDDGLVKRTTDGINWTSQPSGTTQVLNGVWFTSTSTGFAVGANGTILRTTDGGVTWNAMTSGTTAALNSVWFASPSVGWAVGNNGVIRRTTNGGSTWSAQASTTTQNLLTVRGVSASNVWAAGNAGTMVRTTDGSAWSSAGITTGAASNAIRNVFFATATDGWYVGNYGLVRRTTDGGLTWTSLDVGVPTSALDPQVRMNACWFTSAAPYTGYVIGDYGVIRRTVDSGSTWTSLHFGTLSNLNAIDFADAQTGWIGGASGTMMVTEDGGHVWRGQKTGNNAAFAAVSVVSSQTVWATGDNGAIRKTLDGGRTWTGQTSGTTVNLKGISAVDSSHAVVVGQVGLVKYTTDGGSTWTTGSVDTTQQLSSVSMVDTSTGWAVGPRLAGNNVVFHTTDGGATWSPQATTANANLWAVHFRSASLGFAAGDSGVILRTTDGGATWVRRPTPTTLPFYGIRFADDNNGTAVGGGGVLARTADGGTTWALQSSGGGKSLTSVYPLDASRSFIVGSGGTIMRLGDTAPPFTSRSVTPADPDGAGGWYRTDPQVTLSSSAPGNTYYGWNSAAGPFTLYTGPTSVPEGLQTMYYYSVDASGNAESANEATFSVDFTPPDAATLLTATAVTTTTADIQWAESADALSGVHHYLVTVSNGATLSVVATSATIAGLSPGTLYSAVVNAVDVAGNVSATSTPAAFSTAGVDSSPMSTVLGVTPAASDGLAGWYVTTPTVTMAALPMDAVAEIFYTWGSIDGTYDTYATTITPPAGSSTLRYSSHDTADPGHAAEMTQAAVFNLDTQTPTAPSVTASVTSYASVDLSWPDVTPTPSGIDRYDVYRDGAFFASTDTTTFGVAGLTAETGYTFAVVAVNVAGSSSSTASVSATTPMAPLPAAPAYVAARSPSGYFAFVNWDYSRDTLGTANYRIWRSTDGSSYSAIATTTGGLYGATYLDTTLSASTKYWYAISTVDSRGESALSSTATAVWPSISTTTTGPERVQGLSAVDTSGSIYLSWAPSDNPATIGYNVLRADSSLATASVLNTLPISGTGFFDLSVENGAPYYYSVVAIDSNNNTGTVSLELAAKAHGTYRGLSPHDLDADNSGCGCHSAHTATADDKLIRYPYATKDTACDACHPPAAARGEFLDPLAKSRHALAATSAVNAQFTCNTCHRPLKGSTEATASLMRTNSESPCVVVTDTPAGNAFCYSCHGGGSTLPMGDLSGFENSAHNNVPAPTTAGIVCDTCHESHSSRNEGLNRYSGYMMCVECHNSTQSDPLSPDILSQLTLNSDANAKHPLLPKDQLNGAQMRCQNCHNTHSSTTQYPLVDPHDPSPTGTWTTTRGDEKSFCFQCHDGQPLPTSAEASPWAPAVLGSNGATTVPDIENSYQTNVHGFGSRSDGTTTTAYLRQDMGYQYGDVLECRACHDPHGTVNNYALQQNIKSASGLKTVNGVMVVKAPTGYDVRFFCNSCHLFDSQTHDAIAGTSTVTFPMNCTTCHRHIKAGVPSPNL